MCGPFSSCCLATAPALHIVWHPHASLVPEGRQRSTIMDHIRSSHVYFTKPFADHKKCNIYLFKVRGSSCSLVVIPAICHTGHLHPTIVAACKPSVTLLFDSFLSLPLPQVLLLVSLITTHSSSSSVPAAQVAPLLAQLIRAAGQCQPDVSHGVVPVFQHGGVPTVGC